LPKFKHHVTQAINGIYFKFQLIYFQVVKTEFAWMTSMPTNATVIQDLLELGKNGQDFHFLLPL